MRAWLLAYWHAIIGRPPPPPPEWRPPPEGEVAKRRLGRVEHELDVLVPILELAAREHADDLRRERERRERNGDHDAA